MARPKRTHENTESLMARAEAQLQQDIINGNFAPGARLAVLDLSERYAIGATPIREALSRLSALGFVIAVDHRGFRVAALSRDDLCDLISVRQTLECEALRRAMAQGNTAWEGSILAALHQLEREAQTLSAVTASAAAGNPAWQLELDHVHRHFHFALLAACDSPRLIQLHETYYAQTFRYRCMMFARLPNFEVFVEEHRKLAQLAITRDSTACAFLQHHLDRTLTDTDSHPEFMKPPAP